MADDDSGIAELLDIGTKVNMVYATVASLVYDIVYCFPDEYTIKPPPKVEYIWIIMTILPVNVNSISPTAALSSINLGSRKLIFSFRVSALYGNSRRMQFALPKVGLYMATLTCLTFWRVSLSAYLLLSISSGSDWITSETVGASSVFLEENPPKTLLHS
ncbi:hypothetical protein BDQ17DRAFT_1335392 [Cyathus striatus]|nr:hypothetical protein BDQ17DRAFT_1335392 [Cyathus striatus]